MKLIDKPFYMFAKPWKYKLLLIHAYVFNLYSGTWYVYLLRDNFTYIYSGGVV